MKVLFVFFVLEHRSREVRPHLALGKQCPVPRLVMDDGRIIRILQLGGLHGRYERVAA
jgi:hypothetical protein